MVMDLLTINSAEPEISELFRTPSRTERELGLWVDRTGAARRVESRERLRVLGLYGIVCVTGGRGRFIDKDGDPTPVSAGDCMLLFPDVPHAYVSDGAAWRTCWIVYGGSMAHTFGRLGYLDPTRPIAPDPTGAVPRLHARISGLMHRADPHACLERFDLLCSLVRELSGQQQAALSADPRTRIGESVAAYLDAHFREALNPAAIARHFAVSYTHLRRLFRSLMGQSMKEYLTQKRLALAKRLLATQPWPIKRIAANVGYQDEYYFMRLFKKQVGIPPGEYRRLAGPPNVEQ